MRKAIVGTALAVVCLALRTLLAQDIPLSQQKRETQESPQTALRVFDYDRAVSLDFRELSVNDRNGVKVHDVTFASPMGGTVPAYLVVPEGKGPFAGIVFMHWGEGNRTEFLAESVFDEGHPTLASDGSMLLFHSTRAEGIGKCDLNVSFRIQEGQWSDPMNLGEEINSAGDDRYPTLTADGRYLFFLSDRSGKKEIY